MSKAGAFEKGLSGYKGFFWTPGKTNPLPLPSKLFKKSKVPKREKLKRFLARAEFDEGVFHELDVFGAGLHVLCGERPSSIGFLAAI